MTSLQVVVVAKGRGDVAVGEGKGRGDVPEGEEE